MISLVKKNSTSYVCIEQDQIPFTFNDFFAKYTS